MHDANPIEVIKKYHSIIGTPVMIPEWALGWHQSRWGYDTLEKLQDAVKGYNDNSLPLDTIWSDIDYMDSYRDFTIDPTRFGGLETWVKGPLQQGMAKHYIPILDAGISYRPGGDYASYNHGEAMDIFTKTQDKSADLIGKVWPNEAVYPDWSNPMATTFW